MSKTRLEAFSDGVIAILITILVLELRVPPGADWQALHSMAPAFLTYVLSFVFVGIYWNNHHHMVQTAERVNGRILWANLHLLFWLSLIPFATGWMGQTELSPLPTAIYGVVLTCAALAYIILQAAFVAAHGPNSRLKSAVGKDSKGKLSLACCAAAIPLSFVFQWAAVGLYIFVALVWIVPDRRIESRLP
jgi:uncharacterized membrane protein